MEVQLVAMSASADAGNTGIIDPELYPQAAYVGVADGAKTNWEFLSQHTDTQVLDFYHACAYLGDAAWTAYPKHPAQREEWLRARCHDLKHKQGAAGRILREMRTFAEQNALSEPIREKLEADIQFSIRVNFIFFNRQLHSDFFPDQRSYISNFRYCFPFPILTHFDSNSRMFFI